MAKASTSIFRITSFAAQTRLIGLALAALVLIGSAYADAIFTIGNPGGGTVDNIGIDAPQSIGPNGAPPNPPTSPFPGYPFIIGTVTATGRGIPVAFSSTKNNLIRTGGSTIENGTVPNVTLRGGIKNISILPCWSFSTASSCFSFNDIRFTTKHDAFVDDIVITAFVCTPQENPALPCLKPKTEEQLEPNKEDGWTITTKNDEVIWKVEINSPTGFDRLDNVRFANTGAVHLESGIVPEPSSMLLLGSGVLGLAQVLRRKLP